MRTFFGSLFLIAAGLAAWFFIYCILWQDNANRHFVPVPAHLQSSEIKRHSGKHTTYSPEATYTYSYNGNTYTSTRVLAFAEDDSSSWARSVLNRITPATHFDPGNDITAYINPDAPEESILVKEYSFTPYTLTMGSLFIIALGLGMVFGVVSAGRTKMSAIALDDSGWKLLLPAKSVRRRFTDSLFWLLGALIALVPAPLHWLLIVKRADVMPVIICSLAGVLVLVLALTALRRWSVTRHISDARVRIKPCPMIRGQVFAIEAESDAHSTLRVQQLQAKVICTEHYQERRGNKTNTGTRTHSEQTLTLAPAASIPAGQLVEGKGELAFDASLPPTTDIAGLKLYPHYTWELRLLVKLEGMVDYDGRFPLEVD